MKIPWSESRSVAVSRVATRIDAPLTVELLPQSQTVFASLTNASAGAIPVCVLAVVYPPRELDAPQVISDALDE